MKVLHLNTCDIQGGAARAAYRLNKSLQVIGINSLMFVQDKTSDDYTVVGPKTKGEKAISKIRPRLDQVPVYFYKKRQKTLFSPAWIPFSDIIKKIDEIDSDIAHLHWIAGGLIRIEDIAKIQKPIVWTLHDMWAFTGGCHYDNSCGKYEKECGACPILNSDKEKDLSRRIFKRKKKTYNKIKNITVVGLSKWLTDCAAKSGLLGNRRIVNLPNPNR